LTAELVDFHRLANLPCTRVPNSVPIFKHTAV
jgi:hypothetical protein